MTQQRAIGAHSPGQALTIIPPPGAFRLTLAFAVVVSHASALDIGRLAVLLFFFLSGYWTARIWQEKFDGQRLGRFYLSRYWRVAPLYLLITLLAAAVRGWPLHWDNFTLLGVGSTDHDPTGVSWSLDVELQFYFLLPLLMPALGRRPVLMLLASLALAVGGWWLDVRYGITTIAKYLPAFLLGSMTYVTAWKPSVRSANISLALFIAFTALTALTPFLSKKAPDPFDQDIWDFLWMLPLLPYVAHSLTIKSSRLDRDFGNLSFPLYLIHFATITILTKAFGSGLVVKAGAITLACALAVLVYVLFDRPMDRLRVKVTEGPRAAKPA